MRETTGERKLPDPSQGKSAAAPAEPTDLLKQLADNAPLFVQRLGADPTDRHTGILVGNVRNQQLLIALFDGVELDIGERLKLRLGLGSHVVGFETQVLSKLADPPLYVVQFPAKIDATNMRKAQRIRAFFPADVQVQSPGSDQVFLLKTRVLDISSGGCSFRSKIKLPSATVHLSFALPGERNIQSLKGDIIESVRVGPVFHNRVKFALEATNIPVLHEVSKWVADGATFGVN